MWPLSFIGRLLNPSPPSRPARFHSLDALRGIAALAVVFWHWQHFFMIPGDASFDFRAALAKMPLHGVFAPLYRLGWLAIYLFFSLSGFIFYWLYSESISRKAVTVRDFVARRFSRLYPLHLATLLLVLAGQIAFVRLASHPFVYARNDAYHFGLNLFFVQYWGFEKGYSFNGPAWSVSVEVLLYAAFFVLCRRLPVRIRLLAPIALAAFFGISRMNETLGKAAAAFFLGGTAYLLYDKIVRTGRLRQALRGLTTALSLIWPALVFARLRWPQVPVAPRLHLFEIFDAGVLLLLFPATILWLALLETRRETPRGSAGKRFAFLGDLSYASYLLHFPLQLAFMLATTALSIGSSFYSSPWTLALFFAILVPLSLWAHRGFEMPAQRFLRKRLLSEKDQLQAKKTPP